MFAICQKSLHNDNFGTVFESFLIYFWYREYFYGYMPKRAGLSKTELKIEQDRAGLSTTEPKIEHDRAENSTKIDMDKVVFVE